MARMCIAVAGATDGDAACADGDELQPLTTKDADRKQVCVCVCVSE